jgi:hypothetical protein
MNGKERMMIDELKYDYIELTLPNIVGRWDKDKERREIRVEKAIKPFVEALALKYPQWRFVSTSFWHQRPDNGDAYAEAHRFYVYDGREALGEISTDYGRRNEKVYAIRNERISTSRQRGDTTKTKDLNKAVKTVGKMFGAKTINERMIEASSEASTDVYRVYQDRANTFQRTYDHVAKHLMPYIMANYETLAPIAIAGGASAETVGRLASAHDEFKITEEIYKCQQSQDGAVVLIHGSDYAVLGKDDKGQITTRMFSTETLPPHIKRSVGMLKLVEPKFFIKGAGMKINDQAFFVTKEVSDE